MQENIKMNSIYKANPGEYIEKKSRFIATLAYCETQEEAEAFFAAIRKKFYDARHNCTAFIIKENGTLIIRSSDDGEPQGTAGHPMLDVLQSKNLVNVAAVVTRYFGGTLLGTGGLVRSYTKAIQAAVENSIIIERLKGREINLEVDYTAIGKIEYYLASNNIVPRDKAYGENVTMELVIPEESVSALEKEIASVTNGKGKLEVGPCLDFAVLDGKVLTGNELVCG